jgi:MOSC domain-containing protein YiiM
MTMNLIAIQIGQPQTYTDEQGSWETAFFKSSVTEPIFLGELGLDGDAVANTKHHGGPDQAVLLYSADHYPNWQTELGRAFPYGAFAENLQVTKPRIPCWKIARRWGLPDLTKRVTQTKRMGWYCRVLQTGQIEPGLSVALVERPNPEQTVAQAFGAYLAEKK